jgi:hypothetical protein
LSRETAWYGSANYRYSGQIKIAQPWLPILDEIRAIVQNLTRDTYEGALLNYFQMAPTILDGAQIMNEI